MGWGCIDGVGVYRWLMEGSFAANYYTTHDFTEKEERQTDKCINCQLISLDEIDFFCLVSC